MARYALVVGISEYESIRLPNLSKPDKDAEAIASLLEKYGDCEEINMLKGYVSAKQLETAITALFNRQALENDIIIFFTGRGFSIHSAFGKEGYLATSDCDVEIEADQVKEQVQGLSFSSLNTVIQSSNFRSLVMFIDASHSGDLIAGTLFKKSFSAFGTHKDYCLIAACQGVEMAYAKMNENHSVFTSALLQALSPENADTKGYITGDRLFDYIYKKLRGGPQEPVRYGKGRPIQIIRFPAEDMEGIKHWPRPYLEYSDYEDSIENDDEDEGFTLDSTQPIVLMLGWVDHEGIISSIQSSGRQYKKKLLASTPKNWNSITALFDDYEVSSALVKISPHVCSLLVREDYLEVRNSLFERISSVPNLVFVYEDILFGEEQSDSRNSYKPYPDESILNAALKFLRQYQLEITPYKKNAEVTVIAESFLDDTERNLIFRLYFPSEKLWSDEADKFLRLFHNYLSKVNQLAVRLDQKRTAHGTIYEFHGQASSDERDLSEEFQDFSEFLDTCTSDVDAAAALISSESLDAREVTKIVKKYAKEARRLQLDIKHEAESKTISIRHRLESELIDFDLTAEDWKNITSVVETVVPTFSTGTLPIPSQILGSSQHAQHVTYNIQPQFIETVRGVVAQEVSGTQHFSLEHHQMLELIQSYAPENRRDLEDAVYEIADESGKKTDKLKAGKKITAFLIEVGKKTGDIAFSILQKYIESQLGF